MAGRLHELAERMIPDRANRSLMWLIALTSVSLAASGSLFGTLVVYGVYESPFLPTLLNLFLSNVLAVIVGIVVTALVLRRAHPVTRAGKALGFGGLMAATSLAVKLVIVSIVGVGPRDQMGPIFFSVMVLTGGILFATLAAAMLYAASRERAIEDSYAAIARTQAALAHEEESVRAQVFDQLHGSLQAEFVAMRRVMSDLSQSTEEPATAAVAREMDARLERVYRTGVESVARAVSPASIEAGLRAAVLELRARVADACEVNVAFDPIATALDDPMAGGLRRDIRMAAYRVIEEAVSNAIRHSGATHVDVIVGSRLDRASPILVLDICHTCEGTADVAEGEGLRRMNARVMALHGELVILSGDDVFSVHAQIPLQRAQ